MRPPARSTAGGRRPAGPDRRLLRQRLIVFVTVTLLVALGIAAAQGCQGPASSLGPIQRPAGPAASAAPGPDSASSFGAGSGALGSDAVSGLVPGPGAGTGPR
ncbi:hypothetical protein ACSNOD_26465 [Streptomyces sp. URMC 123]